MSRERHPELSAGFTLLELLIVLAVAGLIISLVPPLISAAVPGARLKVAARDLAVSFRETRIQAIRHGAEIDVILKTDPPQYIIGNDQPRTLPKELSMKVVSSLNMEIDQISAQSIEISDKPYVLRFYPDGGATGTLIRLSRNNDSYLVGVDWLVGRVTVSEARTDAR